VLLAVLVLQSCDALLRRCDRAAPYAVLVSTGAFIGLILLAMHAYPGGNAWNPATRGHDFWLNYLCDLERQTALDGQPNDVGAAFAQSAILVQGLASLAFWRLLPAFFPLRIVLGRATRALGFFSAAGVMGVALLPSDAFPHVHPILMVVAGGPGVAAAALGVVGLSTRAAWPGLATLGAAAVLVTGVDLALYLRQLFVDSPTPLIVAVLERVALLLTLAWSAVVAVMAEYASRAPGG
jgi:hypothetical protein